MLARDRLSLSEMSWILIKVFFGCVRALLIGGTRKLTMCRNRSSYLGFDVASEMYAKVLFSPLVTNG